MKICSGIFALFLFFAVGALAQGPRESGWIHLQWERLSPFLDWSASGTQLSVTGVWTGECR